MNREDTTAPTEELLDICGVAVSVSDEEIETVRVVLGSAAADPSRWLVHRRKALDNAAAAAAAAAVWRTESVGKDLRSLWSIRSSPYHFVDNWRTNNQHTVAEELIALAKQCMHYNNTLHQFLLCLTLSALL